MYKRVPEIIFYSIFYIVFTVTAFSQPDKDIIGNWKGAIIIPGMNLDVLVKFAMDQDTVKGSIDIPKQGAKDLPLNKIEIKPDKVVFAIKGVPGGPNFYGKFSEDKKNISGDFYQGGQKFKFELTRKSEDEVRKESQALDEKLKKIRTFIDTVVKSWNSTGAAIGIVIDGKLVFAEGFGYRNVNEKLPVTPNTLFAIGSSSKAFTATSIGILIDEGKADWDKPVKEYYPEFKMYDNFATDRMSLRDLVTHRSGLPRHDLVWYGSKFTRKEMVERLQYLEPNKEFRTTYQYQNLMFMTAGYIAGLINGTTWEGLVKEKIFKPLGMQNTNFSVLESQKSSDYALPYRIDKNENIKKIKFLDISEIGPAGSINSNINDMSKWVMFHLNKGKCGNAQVLSETQMNQMHTPYMTISALSTDPFEISPASYGLGWFISTYRGNYSVSHAGNIDGFSANVSLLPYSGIGIITLTNMNTSPLPGIINNYITDILLNLEPIDVNARLKMGVEAAKKMLSGKKDPERKKDTKPSHKLSDYCGVYENPGYGAITITGDEKSLKGKMNIFNLNLEHWHYDVFKVDSPEREDDNISYMVTFSTNSKGDIDKLSIPFEASVKDIVFMRKGSEGMNDPEYLKKFTGEYDLGEKIVTFSLKGKILTCFVPGQPIYDLEPYKDNEFKIKSLSGYNVKFTVDEKKGVLEVVFLQPNGNFTAKKK